MPNGSLADRTVAISGGSRGIGLQTYIATAAVANMADGDKLARSSRSPEVMADAAVEFISRQSREAAAIATSTPTSCTPPVFRTCPGTAAATNRFQPVSRLNGYARQMISACGMAIQPSGAAAHSRHAAEI